jgi:hypothetical protein
MLSSTRQRATIAVLISACFPALALGAGVARVDFATGNVTAVAPDGRSRALTKGSEIDVGETVATQQGRAQLRFADGAYMSLQPQTEFKVEEFKYSGKASASDSVVLNLLKGGLRTITGLIGRANRNNYRLRTDVATIGIRGTEYSVRYTNSIEVFCADGSIVVQNEGGTLQLNGGQGGYVASNNTPPQQTDNRPVLPPEGPTELFQGEVDDPVNPIQEALPPIVEPAGVTLLTGTIEANVAYASYDRNGLGLSAPTLATLSPDGALTEFFDLSRTDVMLASGTSSTQSAGNDGIIAWGRWVGGAATADGVPFDLTHPLHYVVGLPVANMPTTGSATYDMIGHTTPSLSGELSSASLNSSVLTVDFGWNAATVDLAMTINGQAVSGSTGGVRMGTNGQFTGSAFMGGGLEASMFVSGFLSGDGASRAGVAYDVNTYLGNVVGTIAYQKGAVGASSQTDPVQGQVLVRDIGL